MAYVFYNAIRNALLDGHVVEAARASSVREEALRTCGRGQSIHPSYIRSFILALFIVHLLLLRG